MHAWQWLDDSNWCDLASSTALTGKPEYSTMKLWLPFYLSKTVVNNITCSVAVPHIVVDLFLVWKHIQCGFTQWKTVSLTPVSPSVASLVKPSQDLTVCFIILLGCISYLCILCREQDVLSEKSKTHWKRCRWLVWHLQPERFLCSLL